MINKIALYCVILAALLACNVTYISGNQGIINESETIESDIDSQIKAHP